MASLDLEALRARLDEALPGSAVSQDGGWLVVPPDQLLAVAGCLRDMGYDYLTHLSAADYADRMEVVYNLHSTRTDFGGAGIPFKVRISDRANPSVPSLTSIWRGANVQEREVWDMFGIRFEGHPYLKRILLWEGFEGHPLRKDWREPYYEQEHKPFSSRWPDADRSRIKAEDRVRWRSNVQYPADFDPDGYQQLPEFDVLPDGKIDLGGIDTDQIFVNIGPQHPSTHGVFRMRLGLQGETVTSLLPVIGYLHRNHEKIGERNLWSSNMPYTDRLDYVNSMYNNFGYAVAVERMMGLEVLERAEYIRVIMGELTRVVNHLACTGFMLNDMGAMFTPFLYAFEERELMLDLFEAAAGSRMMCNYFRFGGVARDLPDGWLEKCRELVFNRLERTLDQFERLLTENEILLARCKGVGAMSWQEMVNLSVSGPMLRSAGFAYDIRKLEPYSIYDTFDFDVPTHQTGDMFDRYIQRIDEARESVKILKQALDRMPTHGPVRPEKKVWNPKVPAGELYSRVEHPKGELGFYLVSDGGINPYRYHVRSPSFVNLGAFEAMAVGHLIADAIVLLGTIDITLGEVDR
jgi:NADH:ubiquinone oxidoreductase subunit D/NADH:ubiquinone oxidoreductase subunit C